MQEEIWKVDGGYFSGDTVEKPFPPKDSNHSVFEDYDVAPWARFRWGDISKYNEVRRRGLVLLQYVRGGALWNPAPFLQALSQRSIPCTFPR